jgi:hypothetical protein
VHPSGAQTGYDGYFNVLAKGDEIDGMSVDPGTVLASILRRTFR